MTWKEFKEMVEKAGIRDGDHLIMETPNLYEHEPALSFSMDRLDGAKEWVIAMGKLR